jgi:predicted DNA-binding transcriptional regulator YafY
MPRPPTSSALVRRIELLQRIPRLPSKVSASTLCDSLSEAGYAVSKRTIERDLVELAMHFPLVSDERSTPFGWSWSKAAPTISLAHLSSAHALALMTLDKYAAKLLPPWAIEEIAPFIALARKQMSNGASPARVSAWLEKQIVAPASMPLLAPKIQADVFATCQQALFEGRQLEITYRKKWDVTLYRATVLPQAINYRGQMTYLLCTFAGFDDTRMLALHRIDKADMSDAVAVPTALKTRAELERTGLLGFKGNGQLKLVASFTADAAAHLDETPLSLDQKTVRTKTAQVRVSATVEDAPQLRWWLLGFGESVVVESPMSLRNEMAARVRKMADSYDANTHYKINRKKEK